jgi:hypothetical protein
MNITIIANWEVWLEIERLMAWEHKIIHTFTMLAAINPTSELVHQAYRIANKDICWLARGFGLEITKPTLEQSNRQFFLLPAVMNVSLLLCGRMECELLLKVTLERSRQSRGHVRRLEEREGGSLRRQVSGAQMWAQIVAYVARRCERR